MTINKIGSALLISGFFLAAVSCSNPNKEKENASEDFLKAQEDLKGQIQDVVYDLPSPSEIPYLLEATGAEFDETVLNDRSKADGYLSRNDKAALNLGIYATDIGYLSSYDKVQEAINYMNTARKLADNLGVTGSFDAKLIRRFEGNLGKKDSLAYLLNETVKKTESYLRDDDRSRLAALILTGSFVEGLYISTTVVKSYPKDILKEEDRNLILTPLIRIVLEQKKSVSDLLKMLKTLEQSEPVGALVESLEMLEKTYNDLNIEEQIRSNRGDLALKDENLTSITAQCAKIRKSIVE
jgi:hypothetical protein